VNPGSQPRLQWDEVQVALACGAALHIAAQAPQLLGSLVRLTQAPEQFWVAPGQLEVHLPAEQTSFWPHALAQPPQLAGSESVFTQLSPHLANPTLHVEPHCLAAQVATALAGASQACPQLPQFSGF
jgi:hypothetical protein